MREEERIETAPCGCRFDMASGVQTFACAKHDALAHFNTSEWGRIALLALTVMMIRRDSEGGPEIPSSLREVTARVVASLMGVERDDEPEDVRLRYTALQRRLIAAAEALW